jgi:hypothetical protein
MKVLLTLRNIASGPYFLVSGKTKPDKYRFERVPGQAHLHRLTVDPKEAPLVLNDIGLRTQQLDIPVEISFLIEDSDLDSGELLAAKEETIAAKNLELENLQRQLDHETSRKTPPKQQGGGRRITDEELEMLKERDDMLEALTPIAQDEETPLDVVKRLITAHKVEKDGITIDGHISPAGAEKLLGKTEPKPEATPAPPQLPPEQAPVSGTAQPEPPPQKPAKKKPARKKAKK